MIRKMVATVCALALFVAGAFAIEGKVSRVDADAHQIVLTIDKQEYVTNVKNVKLLKANGDPAQLSDFKADAAVEVTMNDDKKITQIQLQ